MLLLVVVDGQQHVESHVTLSLNEFQDLFSSARLEEAERRLFDARKVQEAEHKQKLKELEDWKRAAQEEGEVWRSHLFPQNYQVLRHTANGFFNSSSPESGVERDVASFDLEVVLRVMAPQWTVVPLANTTCGCLRLVRCMAR